MSPRKTQQKTQRSTAPSRFYQTLLPFDDEPPPKGFVECEETMQASFNRNLRTYFRGRFPGGPDVSFDLLRKGTFRTIGMADVSKRTISLHTELLDPMWSDVMEFVMYHEMLHFAELYHNTRFRARERRFENFDRIKEREARFFASLDIKYGKRQIHVYRCPRCDGQFRFRSRRGHLYFCGICGTATKPVALEFAKTELDQKPQTTSE